MHPHCEQSGVPPNWHGVMRCSKSAEMQLVVSAKTHSSGLFGGFGVLLDEAFRHRQLLVPSPQRHQRGDHALAIGGRQDLGGDLADLRRVEAHPDLATSSRAPTRAGGTPRDSRRAGPAGA